MGTLLTTNTVMQCPHGGMVNIVCANQMAKADGGQILRAGDVYTIAGCPLTISGAPHPCVTVEWTLPSLRSKAIGDSALTTDSIGLCKAADQAVQGVVIIQQTQMKASAI
ncbi:hypothetical protein AAU61_13200 [Desulfocarbo indianensis]|nr:hypothetical protein AAU61_13200 [Desulfocarbo indianensis]